MSDGLCFEKFPVDYLVGELILSRDSLFTTFGLHHTRCMASDTISTAVHEKSVAGLGFEPGFDDANQLMRTFRISHDSH